MCTYHVHQDRVDLNDKVMYCLGTSNPLTMKQEEVPAVVLPLEGTKEKWSGLNAAGLPGLKESGRNNRDGVKR